MKGYLDERYVDRQSIVSYQRSEVALALFFIVIDLITIIILAHNLKSRSSIITSLKSKIIKLFEIDIIIRILSFKQNNKLIIYMEVIFNISNTCLFYLILAFLDQAFINPKITNLQKSKDKGKRIMRCFIFFIITFSYENLPFSPLFKNSL